MKVKGNGFIKNLSYAFIAQSISLLSSFVIQFFCPKLLGVTEFAYWQLFLFYVSYINISRLGIIDGMYLKYGGKKENELDVALIKTEWLIYIVIQLAFGICMSLGAMVFISDSNRIFVFLACVLCLVIINSNNYFGFIFQAINKTSIYSISEVIYNLLWFVAVLVLLVFKINSFKVIVSFYIIGQVLAGIYLVRKSKFIFLSKITTVGKAFADLIVNMKIGLPLLIAMYASMLITGCVRMVVDFRWGIEVFGFFSFAMSLTTFILKFISQVSMVMFPALKRINIAQQKNIYEHTNGLLSIGLPAALIMFIPVKRLIVWWLPEYSTSMLYLGILLPICIFDGKMQLLYSTYLKIMRKERYLLLVNVVAVLVSLLLTVIGAYVIDSLESIAWALLLAVAIRSIFSSIILSRWMKIKTNSLQFISELALIILFALISTKLSDTSIFIIYLLAYIFYLTINYKLEIKIIKNLKVIWKGAK